MIIVQEMLPCTVIFYMATIITAWEYDDTGLYMQASLPAVAAEA